MIIKDRIKENFNKGADTYTQAAELQVKVADRLAARLSGVGAKAILEIGCGTGILSQHLITQFPEAQILLTDIAPAMVQVSQSRFASLSNVMTDCIDGENITLSDSFDLIVSSMTLHWFKHINQSIQHLIKKLNKNGKLCFAILGSGSMPEWHQMCRQFNIPLGTPLMPTDQDCPGLNLQIETIKQTYPNLHAFLAHFKLLGANTPRADYVPLTPSQLRPLLRSHHHEIEISYEVIFGEYQRV